MKMYFSNLASGLMAKSIAGRSVLCLLVLCSLPAALRGQGTTAEPEPIQIEFTALSLGGTLRNWQYGDSVSRHAITIPNAARSPQRTYKGEPVIRFYDAADTGAEGVLPPPAASVDMTGRSGKWLFVFLPKSDGGYRIYPIEDGTETFAAGTWKVFNFSPDAMALKVADAAPFVIAPSGGSYVFSNGQRENVTERVQVAIYRQEEWAIAYRSLWGLRPDSRSLVFLIGDGGSDKILVRRFHQTVTE